MMETKSEVMTTKELSALVSQLMEREEARIARERRKSRRRITRHRKAKQAAAQQLARSVEVIKWCIVGISTVMALALLIMIAVVWQLGSEAQRIKAEVQQVRTEAAKIVTEIGREAESIRDRIQHPLRTLGGAVGNQLEERIGTALSGDDE